MRNSIGLLRDKFGYLLSKFNNKKRVTMIIAVITTLLIGVIYIVGADRGDYISQSDVLPTTYQNNIEEGEIAGISTNAFIPSVTPTVVKNKKLLIPSQTTTSPTTTNSNQSQQNQETQSNNTQSTQSNNTDISQQTNGQTQPTIQPTIEPTTEPTTQPSPTTDTTPFDASMSVNKEFIPDSGWKLTATITTNKQLSKCKVTLGSGGTSLTMDGNISGNTCTSSATFGEMGAGSAEVTSVSGETKQLSAQ